MKYKINEIFYSIQGEGFWVGTPAIFIRFSGCNLHCPYCDTDHEKYNLYSIEQIFAEINLYKCSLIILTGGEPTLQIDEKFVAFFQNKGYKIHIESNGTNTIPKNIDWITISPKQNWKIIKGNELKVIYCQQDLNQYNKSDFQYYFLQPCSMQNLQDVIEKIKEENKWRLSIQLHKLLKIK